MVVRLVAVALTLVMTGTPIVATACEGMCALRANDGGTAGERHSCHHEASPANETAISSAPHLCGHSDDSPSAVAQSSSLLVAPAIVAVTFELAPPTVGMPPAGVAPGHGPPLISSRSAQLRI